MKKLPYNAVRNRIYNYCLVPSLVGFEVASRQNDTDILQDTFLHIEQIALQLKPYEERIQKYYLTVPNNYLILELIDQQTTFNDFDDFIVYLRSLSEKTILTHIILCLTEDKSLTPHNIPDTHFEFDYLFEMVEQYISSVEQKWTWLAAIHKPKIFINELADLLLEIAEWFTPIYDAWEAECIAYHETFNIEQFFEKYQSILSRDILLQKITESYHLITLVPFITYFMLIISTDTQLSPTLLSGTRIEQYFDRRYSNLNDDTRTELLKHLSDATRYQILQLSATGEYKAKEMAEKLNITPAAVSYHMSKLTSSGLLTFQTKENKSIEQQVNQAILKQLIEKIATDFEIPFDK